MAFQFDATLPLNDERVLEFLLSEDTTLPELVIPPPLEPGFRYPNTFESPATFPSVIHNINFPAFETWHVYKRLAPAPPRPSIPGVNPEPDAYDKIIGVHNIHVILLREIEISVIHYLSIKGDLVETDYESDLKKLLAYKQDPASNLAAFEAFLADNLTQLQPGDFYIKPALKLTKRGSIQEVDVQERVSIETLYKSQDYNGHVEVIKGGEYNYKSYIDENDIIIKRHKFAVVKPEQESALITAEVAQADYDADPKAVLASLISGPIAGILDELFPAPCGAMRRHEFKILSFPALPEFKFGWVTVSITIGCVSVRISVPIIQIRISTIHFYAYYSIFANASQSIWEIAKNCALKAAIESAVLGIITLNPGVAMAAFESSFKDCIIRDITNCIDGGLFAIKAAGKWVP